MCCRKSNFQLFAFITKNGSEWHHSRRICRFMCRSWISSEALSVCLMCNLEIESGRSVWIINSICVCYKWWMERRLFIQPVGVEAQESDGDTAAGEALFSRKKDDAVNTNKKHIRSWLKVGVNINKHKWDCQQSVQYVWNRIRAADHPSGRLRWTHAEQWRRRLMAHFSKSVSHNLSSWPENRSNIIANTFPEGNSHLRHSRRIIIKYLTN